MRGSSNSGGRERAKRILFACTITMAMLVASMASIGVVGETADARGDIYAGLQTEATGPAHFGPAPNPYPYCDSPTYFDPFPDNGTVDAAGNIVDQPRGSMNVGDFSEVTTDGNTMRLTIDAEGTSEPVYPGFFPDADGNGGPNDQPKGIEMASGDEATVTLSNPLFYSQWVFTDVDRANEGFFVTPSWLGSAGEVFIIGGDSAFTLDSTTPTTAHFNDTNTVAQDSEDIEARVQVDFLGAVDGLKLVRDVGSGQSGFAVGGGCEAAGAAKVLVDGPTWNGTSFDVTYELRVRNNLPSSATLADAILQAEDDAIANNREFYLTGQPSGIPLQNLQLEDDLTDPSFSAITVVDVSTDVTNNLILNNSYNGVGDIQLLDLGSSIDAETDEVITLEVQYTPDLRDPKWNNCRAPVSYLNQSVVKGQASTVDVSDLSDDGVNPAPNANNGSGGVDDPTPVSFPCPPAELEIVKTVVPAGDACPATFLDGVLGEGTPLVITANDSVTYCVSVRNPGIVTATNVTVTDPMASGSPYSLPDLAGGVEDNSISYTLQLGPSTPAGDTVTNVATVTGTGPGGALSDSDPAVVTVDPLNPELDIVKTVLPAGTACPAFADGNFNTGPPLQLLSGDTATYCISVKNIGDIFVNDVVVTDEQAAGVTFDNVIGGLAVGAEGTVTFDLVVDVDTPNINTAFATGVGPYGQVGPVSEQAHINVTQTNPIIEIVKTVVPGGTDCPAFVDGIDGPGDPLLAPIGSTVTYCISVRNIGNATATNVTITDDQSTESPWSLPDLAPGAEDLVQFDIVITADTAIVNVACAEVDELTGLVCDDAVIEKTEPELEIVKTAITGPDGTCPAFDAGIDGPGAALIAPVGSTVTYCISVRNIGDAVATNVMITDPQSPDSPYSIGDLAPGDGTTVSYDLVISRTAPPAVNTACANADEDIDEVCDDSVIKRPDDPTLEIVKTALRPGNQCPSFDDGVDGLGDPVQFVETEVVTYCITVRNAGPGPATNVMITDDQAPNTFDMNVGDLAEGATATRSYDLVVSVQTPTVNTAIATGNGPNGALAPADDPAQIAVSLQPDPVLEIVKTVVPGPNGECPATFDDGVLGDGPALPVTYTETVTYCITVRNTGENPATSVSVADPQAPGTYSIGELPVGEERSRSYDLVVGADTATKNTATVAGNGPNGPVPEDEDSALIEPTADANISLIHSVAKADEECIMVTKADNSLVANLINTDVTWCARVTNTGDVPLTNVVLNAPEIGVVDVDVLAATTGNSTLAPGESVFVEVAGAIPAAGLFSNGSVVGDPSDAQGNLLDLSEVSDTDDAEVREAAINLETTVVPGVDGDCADSTENASVAVGDVVTWCFEVTNTGTIDLLVETVTDITLGIEVEVPTDEQVIVPGDTVLVSTTSVVTEALLNDAEVKGQPLDLDGELLDQAPIVEDDDPATVDIPGTPGADPAIEKSVSNPGPVDVGTQLTYTLNVTNNGPDTAQGVVVTDQLPVGISYVSLPGDADWACSLTSDSTGFSCLKATDMANGDSVTLTYTARVNAGAQSNTSLTNVAEVSSETPDTDLSNNRDTAVTTTPPPQTCCDYPGPFPTPTPVPVPEVPDEVLGLAITGSSSNLLGLISTAMLAIGGLLMVGARRSRDD